MTPHMQAMTTAYNAAADKCVEIGERYTPWPIIEEAVQRYLIALASDHRVITAIGLAAHHAIPSSPDKGAQVQARGKAAVVAIKQLAKESA